MRTVLIDLMRKREGRGLKVRGGGKAEKAEG
jgi:hypothetical protein